MFEPGRIRILVLGLIRDGDRIFVSEGYDPAKQSTFYRALGGGVDFGETSRAALEREFFEELQAQLTNIHYLGCIENIFEYNGQPNHELIQLYQCEFADRDYYDHPDKIWTFTEGDREPKKALWVEISRFKSGELRLVPEQFFEYL